MRIAVLGGSFDPPHIGHLQVAKQVKQNLEVDEVWLMPCYLHPFGKKLSAANDRLSMTKLVEENSIKASDLEIKRQEISYTIDTLERLKKKFPDDEFFWVISSSELESFDKWKDWQKIIKDFELIVFPREINKNKLEELIKKHLNVSEIPENIFVLNHDDISSNKISSGQIRKLIKEGEPVDKMIDPKVKDYIIKNNLYGN